MAGEDSKAGSFRYAFNSWWVVLGIIASSITGFRLLLRITYVQLAKVTAYVVTQYHQLVHLPVWRLFCWMHLPNPPEWAIDAMVLWLLIGGITLRSASSIRKISTATRSDTIRFAPYYAVWKLLFAGAWTLPIFVFVCLFFWPVLLKFLFLRPVINESCDGDFFLSRSGGGIAYTMYWASHSGDGNAMPATSVCGLTYVFDIRLVLAYQFLAAVGAISLWTTWNALAAMYGG